MLNDNDHHQLGSHMDSVYRLADTSSAAACTVTLSCYQWSKTLWPPTISGGSKNYN